MKNKFIILILSVFYMTDYSSAAGVSAPGRTSLSGKITDKLTGEPLPGVSVYIPDLKTGTISNGDGNYKIENLPQAKVLVQVSLISYKLIAVQIDLSVTTIQDFSMEQSVAELNEVVVTGLSQAVEKNRTPTPVTTISAIQLNKISSTNIIDAIATMPGISQITTGSGISKPVIRGLGYNRVVVVKDGIRQEGQQWGDEHGIEIDEFSINKAEILKGPASLAFGSDAMAGVINLLSAPTLPDGNIAGNLLANYQTNNGLFGCSANLAGNNDGFIWDIRYSNKIAHAYQNKYDGYVFNSGLRENNFGGITGFNKSWGYAHLHFSMYNLTPGIVEGERDSVTGEFIKPVMVNDTTEGYETTSEKDNKSYEPFTPFQKIHHYKLVMNNSFILGNGSIKTIIGWQQNQRQEYADVLNKNQYGLYFLLNTINYDIRYNLPEKNNFNLSFGANGMFQESKNKGTEFLIPEYNLFDIGFFGIIKKSYNSFDFSGGLRFDSRNEQGKDLFLTEGGEKTETPDSTSYHQFVSFQSLFSGVSGSAGATYQFNEIVFTKLNLSRGFRSPNIAELSANGVHEGTTNFIIGDAGLKAENSWQFDYSLGINSHHITAQADLFYNYITNYIYSQKLNSSISGDSLTDGYRTFKYTSGNANLFGGEISFDIHPHPLDWLHFENSFSYVQSVQLHQPDSTKYLPLTPAPKFSSEIRADADKLTNMLHNAFVKLGLDYTFAQNKFYAAYGTETATSDYLLINIALGADFVAHSRVLFSLFININNLADVAYQSHLSRLKYDPVNNYTGRSGIYNMGRNISFKLIIPIDIKKQK